MEVAYAVLSYAIYAHYIAFFFFLMKFGVAHDVQALAFDVSFPIGMSSSMSVGLL